MYYTSMPYRTFASNEYYHCYNRGTDKRIIFNDRQDYKYFLKSMRAYNTAEVRGKLRLHKNTETSVEPPITILSYCLLPNHFHLLLRSNIENGISKYMQRLGVGYTMYFNKKYERSGGLFQGTFKAKHVATDQDLRQVFSYVVLNNKVHGISDKALYRVAQNNHDSVVRDLVLNYTQQQQVEAVQIIKELRLGFDE